LVIDRLTLIIFHLDVEGCCEAQSQQNGQWKRETEDGKWKMENGNEK
jgi:hypothetical protein